MGKPITNKGKINFLLADNQRLMEENRRLKSREQSELIDRVIHGIQQYDKINLELHKKYKELNTLKWTGIQTNLIYQWRFLIWKFRKNRHKSIRITK